MKFKEIQLSLTREPFSLAERLSASTNHTPPERSLIENQPRWTFGASCKNYLERYRKLRSNTRLGAGSSPGVSVARRRGILHHIKGYNSWPPAVRSYCFTLLKRTKLRSFVAGESLHSGALYQCTALQVCFCS